MGSFTATKSYVIPAWAEHGGNTMSGFDETNVPSTHYQSVNGELIPIPKFIPPTQEVVPMSEITQNPFPIQKEEEPMKIMIRHTNGLLYEHNLSLLTKPFEQMSNMDIVLGWIKAYQVNKFLNENMNIMTNKNEYDGFNFNPRWETLIEVDDDVLDAKNLVTKFLDHQWNDENYRPGYMYSYRFMTQKIKQHGSKKGEGSVEIVEFVVSDLSAASCDESKKHRLLFEFNTYVATTSGSHYQKKWPYALMVTRTKDGLRNMWVRVRGKKGQKFIFGVSYGAMANKKLVPMTGRYASEDIVSVKLYEYLQDTTQFADWMPIAKYLEAPKDDIVSTHILHPFEIDMSMLYWIGGSNDVKAIVNKAYGKSGVTGVTKHMFGGRNNIDSIEKLQVAVWFARILRDFPATVFNNIDLNLFVGEPIRFYDTNKLSKFFKTFGTRQHYIDQACSFARNNPEPALTHFSFAIDAMMAFKQIPTRQHRMAIVNHVKNNTMSIHEIHNYVNAEWAKIRHENKKIKGRKGSIYEQFMAKQGHWINEKIQMISPTETHELVEWGAVQNNCIGTYAEHVYRGDSMIVGFKDTLGDWIGHAEIDTNRNLRQLLGKHNKPLAQEDRSAITKYLETDLNIQVPRSYWGSADELDY